MGLTLDEYRKMKKEGRVKWDANTVRGSQKEITDFLTAAAGTNSRNFDKNKEVFGALSAKKRYLQAYVNSLKGTEGYEQARDTFTELNTAYNKAGDYFKSIKNGQEITDGVKKMTAYGAGAGIGAAATAEKSVPAETRLEALQKEREKINSEISGRRYQGSGAAQETSDLKKQLESYDRRIEETRQEIAGNAERDAEVNERERNVRLKAKYGGLGYKQLLNAYSHTENDAERAYLKGAIEKEMTENQSPEIIKASIRELESQSEADSRRAAGAQPYDGAEKLKQGSIAHIQKMYGDEISLLKSILPKAERLEKKNRYMLSKYAEDFEESSKLIEEKPIKNVMGSPVTVVGNQKREDRDELDKKKYMTDEEQAVYNYLYNKKGLENADDFVRTIEPDLNERMTRTQEEKARELADSGFWGGLAASVQSLGFNLASGGGVIEDIVRQATGQELDTKSVWHLPANLRNAERETVEKNIDNPLMKKLYGALMSTADSAVNMLITKGAGTVAGAFGAGTEAAEKIATGIGSFIFSSQAATQEVIEAKAKGLDDGQAVGLGIIHGLAEYISEKYSIEQILSDPDIWYKAIAKAGFAEGSEEVASNWITRPFDLMIEGDKNENIRRYNEYLKQGYSKTEAVTKLLGDFVTEDTEAFAAGALSGVGMSGASRGYNYISEKISEAHEKHLDKKAFISFCDKLAKEAETMPDYEAAKAELIEQAKNSGIKKAVKMAERFEQQLETLKSADIANLMYVMETEKAEPAAAETETVTEKAEPETEKVEPETEKTEPAAAKVEPETEKTGPAAAKVEPETAKTETAGGNKTEMLGGRYYSDGQRVIDGEKLQVHPFGRSNKEGIWAYSIKNGDKTFKLTMVESSEREQGANDNTVTFKTEDGRTVTSDEITFLSRDMQLIADYAKNFDTLGARAAFSSFESYKEHAGEKADTGEYLKNFEKAYQLGQRGVSYDAAKSYKSRGLEAVERVIGATAARYAVNSGMYDIDERISFESGRRVRLRMPGQKSGAGSRVELDFSEGYEKSYTDAQKELLQAIAIKTGRNIVLTDKLTDANGVYDPKDGKIYISAEADSGDYMIATALHEAVHGLRDADPEAYGVLEGFITNYLEEKGVSIDRLIDDINERWGRRDDAAAMEELVCQTVMAVASDEAALRKAVECRENKGLLRKALDAVKKIAQGVRDFIKGVSDGTRHNLQAQPWVDDLNALDRLAEELSRALDSERAGIETFEQKNNTHDGVRYSFGGVKAQTADNSSLKTAEDMERSGKDSEIIRRETGWHRGYDGKWRFEIDDSEMKIKDRIFTAGTLDELIEHDRLFKAYPKLKNLRYEFERIKGGARGYIFADDSGIILDDMLRRDALQGNSDKLKKILIHEIQHYIQHNEKFAGGTNPQYEKAHGQETVFNNEQKAYKKLIKAVKDNYDNASSTEEDWKTADQLDEIISKAKELDPKSPDFSFNMSNSLIKIVEASGNEDVITAFQDWIDARYDADLFDRSPDLWASNRYIDSAGEIEARDSSERLNLSEEERKAKRPDIDKDKVVIADNGEISEARIYGVPKNRVFPPYNESQSDANEWAMRWARKSDVNTGDQRLATYRGRWYIIEKFDDTPYGYQIIRYVKNKDVDRVKKELEERYGRNKAEKMEGTIDEIGISRREQLENGEERYDFDAAIFEHSGESDKIFGLDRYEKDRRGAQFNADESAVGSNEDRQGNGTSGLEDNNDLRFAVDDSINDELLELDEELFWEDNRKYIDEFIKADPESSVLAIYNSISKTAEGVIRGFKGVRLKDKDHRSIARQIMRKYDIKAAISPDAEERIAERIERFVKDVRSGDGAEFFELLNELASDCKTFIAESGHFDKSWMQEERETLLDMLKGRTLIIRNYEESQILENFGGMKGLRRAFLGKVNVGYERNLDNIRNPAYIEEIAEAFGEQFAALVDDSEKDSFEGWTWLDRMLNSTLKPKFVNPFYDGVRESADTAAVEMAFEMTNGVVKKISEAAARDKTADKKSIIELKEKNALAFSEKEALAKAKAEKYKKLAEEEKQRRIEQRKRYIERIDNAREYSAEQRQKMQKRLNRLNREYEKYKGSWLEEKKSAREEYIEAREKVRYRKLLAKELGRMTKMLDGKTNNNQYIPEQLKAPVLGLLSAFEVETPGGKRLPHYWQSFKSLDDVGARLDELLDEYKRLKSAKPAENVFGDMFNADGMEFDEELYNGLENLKEQVRGKNVYALNSNDLKGIYEGIRALDAQLKAAAQVIIDGKTAFAKQAAADAVDETLAFKDRSKGARSLLNAAVSWHLDPVRFGRFLSGYNDDHVVAKLFRDLHEGDKKRVRIIYKAFTEIERTLGSEFTGKERRALQIKDVEQFDFRDRKTKERVKITDGMLLSIYLTNRQKAGHRHLVNDKFDHYTVIPDLDMLNRDNIPVIGNVVSELSNSKSRARDPQFRHEVRFTEEDLTQINSYIEHNERLMKLADAISEVFNGQIKDEINKVSLQRYGKMIATVSEYFPIVTDRLDPNKKYRTEIGDSLRDLRVKSRSFTKNRSFSYNAIVIDDVLSVFARHVQETAEYCGMLMPVENFKRIYTISGGDMTLEGALAEKFGGSAGKYIAHLMDDIQKPKDMRDENILVRAGGHLMGSVLMLNPGATIKQFAAYPTAFKYFGITNVSKAIPASVIKGKKLVEKYSEYTPYMWYRENGNGTVVADVSRQLSLRNKSNNFFDIMGKTDKFVVNSLLYAAQEHVRKKRGDLAFDSEEFKQEVARQFENAIDESQPNNMLTSKPQFVRNDTLRTLSLNAFLSQNMAMGNGVIDSVLELAVRTNEFRALKTEESKKAFAAAVKKFFSHSFGVVLSGAFLSALKQIADLFIYHKWDDTKDEEGKTAWDKIAGRWFGDFIESVAGAFAQGDFIVNTIGSIVSGDAGRYNSLSVMSLGKLDELVKSVQQGNYLKFYGAVMDMSGLPLLGGNNIQRLLKGTSLTAKDIILGNAYPIGAGYTVFKNNGELDTKALSYHVVERMKNGEKNKAEDYVKLWREDIVSNKGKSAEDANAEIKDKLAEALAESDDDVTEMAVARENESYGEYDKLFEKVTGYGFDPADVEKAADKALTLIRKEIKENGAEDIEAELERRGFNSEAVRKLMKKWRLDNINELMEDVFDKEEASPFDDTSSGKAVQYTVRDGFNALKNGDDTLDDIREYVVEHSESISTAEEFDKRIRSGTYVNPLIKEYLEALDGKDEERRSELKKQLVNIFGSWNEASGAIKKYQKRVGQ